MSKEGRTYAIVRLDRFKKTHFADAKNLKNGQGRPLVITTSYESMLKSLDGSLGLIKWRGLEPQGLPAVRVEIFETQAGLESYFETNRKKWFQDKAEADKQGSAVRTAFAAIAMNSETRPGVEAMAPKERKAWKYAAAVGAAAALAYAAFSSGVL
jgi:hypothetical protein